MLNIWKAAFQSFKQIFKRPTLSFRLSLHNFARPAPFTLPEVAKAQEVRFGELKAELIQQTKELDSNGWNPAGERRVTESVCRWRWTFPPTFTKC